MTVGATSFKIDGKTCTLANFTPAEVGHITGFSPALQRVWKRRGQLPLRKDGPALFTAPVIAEMFVRHQLSLNGVPPGDSANLGSQSAAVVVWHALLNTDGACEVLGPHKEVQLFLSEFREDHHLATKLSGVTSEIDYRYLYRCDGSGEFRRGHDIQHITATANFTTLALVDLNQMGTVLGTRARRPLLTVEWAARDTPPSDWIRRLTRA